MAPLVPIVAGAIVAAEIGVSVAAATWIATGVVYIGAAALTTGASYLLQRTMTDKAGPSVADSPAAINTPESRGATRQPVPPQRIVYGEARVGGPWFFYETSTPYLFLGQLISTRGITSYDALYVGEKRVRFNEFGGAVDEPYLNSKLLVGVQPGMRVDQPVNTIFEQFASYLGPNFRHPMTAVAVVRLHYGYTQDDHEAMWGNVAIPSILWQVKGAKLYDPRNPVHRLPNDPTDPLDMQDAMATWAFSNNAALVQADWAMMPYGLNAGPQRIRWDEVARAADFDDEPVGMKDTGGLQPRHTIDGVVRLNEKPLTVMEAMLTANRGFVVPRNGHVVVRSSQPVEPRFTISSDMMIGQFTYQDTKPKRDLANITRCTFIAPDRDYQDAEGPVQRREDLITEDGEEFEQSVRLPFTATHNRAQRIMKGFMSEVRLGKQLVCQCSMRAFGLFEGDAVMVSNKFYPEIDGLYMVDEWGLNPDLSGVTYRLTEYDPSIARDWNPATDEQPFALSEIAA